MGKQLGQEFYDKAFSNSEKYKKIYSETPWFPVWTEIISILKNYKPNSILELGCGPGQLAHYILETNDVKYIGLDFSLEAIKIASKNLLSQNLDGLFLHRDINDADLDSFEYDCVVATEFLEHIHNDIEILEKVKKDAVIIGTLPNKDSAGHVRFYPNGDLKSEVEIKSRYSHIGEFLIFKKVKYSSGKNHDYLFAIKRG